MLPTIIFLSFVTVAAFLFLMLRLMRWRTLMRHAVKVDVLFTLIALMGSMGTITGLAVAITSGLLLAIFLTCAKAITKAYTERFGPEPVIETPKPKKRFLRKLRAK